MIESVNGPLNYSVLLDNGNSRRVHIEGCPEPSALTSTESRSPEELVDTVVQSSPLESDPLVSAPDTSVAGTLGVSAATSQQESTPGDAQPPSTNNESSLREPLPPSVTQPQVHRSSRSVRAPV